jgi:uncharacterized Zn finger protein (UPF0148 family)
MLARLCPKCGVVLSQGETGTRGPCATCRRSHERERVESVELRAQPSGHETHEPGSGHVRWPSSETAAAVSAAVPVSGSRFITSYR